ncbi:MAG: hypothetical protein QM527_03100 [Alphaproteobacteria bacterium]|nr:hypothetical protein [Alphaproteobacteria bacterium]
MNFFNFRSLAGPGWSGLGRSEMIGLMAILAGCASHQPITTSYTAESVRVMSSIPMSEPSAQEACPAGSVAPESTAATDSSQTGFCVLYERQGQTFSVWLPSPAGDTLTIQLPLAVATPEQVQPPYRAPTHGLYPVIYPIVIYGGVHYRTRPYAGPIRPYGHWHRPVPPRHRHRQTR